MSKIERSGSALRVGVLQGGVLVEERLIGGDRVRIGPSARDEVIVPAPQPLATFERRRTGWTLHVEPGVETRIANEGRTPRSAGDPTRTLALGPRSRGKLACGNTVVLFQLVALAPPVPRPRLPPSLRGSLAANLDWMLIGVLAVSIVGHTGLAVYLRNLDWPRRPEMMVDVPERWPKLGAATFRLPEPRPVPPSEKRDAPTANAPIAHAGGHRTHRPPAPPPRTRAGLSRAQLAAALRTTGALAVLTRPGRHGEHGSITDLLARGNPSGNADRAFAELGGVGIGSRRGSLLPVGGAGTSGRVAGIDGLRWVEPDEVETGERAERDAPPVRVVEEPPVDPTNPDFLPAIAAEVAHRKRAFSACYEHALRRNPSLAGKVSLRLRVTPVGRVSGEIEEDAVGDAEMGRCLVDTVGRWRFAPVGPKGIEVTCPFIFTRSN